MSKKYLQWFKTDKRNIQDIYYGSKIEKENKTRSNHRKREEIQREIGELEEVKKERAILQVGSTRQHSLSN